MFFLVIAAVRHGAGIVRYDAGMPAQIAVEINGRLEIEDLARYQYYHQQRRIWPVSILIVAIALITIIAFPFILMDSSSDWRPIIINAIPFFMLILFWLGLLFILPR